MSQFFEKYFKFIKSHIPDSSTVEISAVGIDIAVGECKMVEIVNSPDGFELINWAAEPVEQGDVAKTIEKLMGQLQKPCPSPYTSISGRGTLIRYIDMPRMTTEELKKSFSIEADKYFPFPADQIYTDCYILDSQGKDKHMTVMAAAAKKELVDKRIKLLSDLGLKVEYIGINAISLANVFNVLGDNAAKDEKNGIALLDMGESVSNLTIFIKNNPVFIRDIFVGGRDLTKRISNALEVDFNAAEVLKKEPKDQLTKINSACESALMNIVEEIKLSFDYFSTEKNLEVSKLLLTGGGSMLEGIPDILSKNLELDVSRWDPIALIKLSADLSKKEIEMKSMKLGVALGLALYHYA